MILKDLALTLIETREVICILLKELESLQSTLKNTKPFVPKTDFPVQEKELSLENETTSSNESENDKHKTEINEYDLNEIKEIDNEWYTFVANDKKSDSKNDLILESKEIVVKQTLAIPFHLSTLA